MMKVTNNKYAHSASNELRWAALGWDEGYRQALFDLCQHMIDGGHFQVAQELLEIELRKLQQR